MAFTSLTITNAVLEGVGSISKLAFECNEDVLMSIQELLSMQPPASTTDDSPLFGYSKETFLQHYEEKKKALQKLLILANTGSLDYKRFSFLIQLLMDFMNPRLNPFFYENITFEKAAHGMMVSLGVTPLPSTSDARHFVVGVNLATSKGFVIYENEVMQLLYFPTMHKLKRENPVFIVPPWINKYYIFDLSEHNSFIAWLNKQGISVYCVSWVNPDHTFAGQTLQHYVVKGVHKGVEKAMQNENGASVNIIGYCVGGVAAALYAGWAKRRERNTYASLTFLATPFDFDKLDNLRLFICEDELVKIEKIIEKEGFLSGGQLARTFSLMRANDMIVQSIIDQVYLEKEPKPLDFLFWNADITHLPGKMHIEYLRRFFIGDGFFDQARLLDTPLNLKNISCPVYSLGTVKDHIVPWESCYAAHVLFNDVTFCLGGSGHVSGIINPPEKEKYGYFTNTQPHENASDWKRNAVEHNGSWWKHWIKWAESHLGGMCANNPLDSSQVIEKAPGRYALQKASLVKNYNIF